MGDPAFHIRVLRDLFDDVSRRQELVASKRSWTYEQRDAAHKSFNDERDALLYAIRELTKEEK